MGEKETGKATMDTDRIDRIIDKHQGDASSLIQVLLEIQSEHHWLPKEALERVSERLGVPFTQVLHVATFYKAFSLVPKGRHEIHVCVGTACHVRGARPRHGARPDRNQAWRNGPGSEIQPGDR